jgi:ferredoxin--NADP+ reductase
MYRVVASRMIVPNVHVLTVEAPNVARAMQPGQFVIVRAEEEGERIPLSVSDWDAPLGTLTLVFLNIGATTARLAKLQEGSYIPTVVGPLGKAAEIGNYGTVLCIGGCYGIGSVYPIARALKAKGNRIIALLEARSSYLFYWEDRYRHLADRLVHITRDGTSGYKGHVGRLPEILKALEEPVHRAVANGCTFLIKRASDVTRTLELPITVSLNPIMIDGTGMCGVCRVSVNGATRFACVDGPDFEGHQVDWNELRQRRKTYMAEEVVPLRTSRCEDHAPHEEERP